MKKLLVLMCLFVSSFAFSQNIKTYIPEKAKLHLDTLKTEQQNYFPEIPYPWYLGGLIEHESCISLKHSRCWDPKSELKTKRERGLGLGQLTIAYKEDGSVRFDALTEMRVKHKVALKELEWQTLSQRPDLQMRSIILMTRDNYKFLYNVTDEVERLKFADAAYNGGLGGLQKERRACGLKEDCDPQYWDDNVENVCLKSKKVLYGSRSACDINRHHVDDIFNLRMTKYEPYLRRSDVD